MKKLLTIALSVAALNANAGIIEDLKNEPVSKFELGKMKISLAAHFATQELAGSEYMDSKLDLQKISPLEDTDQLGLTFTHTGRSKYLSQDTCIKLNHFAKEMVAKSGIVLSAFPDLAESDYDDLYSDFQVSTVLASKENSNLTISCK